MQFAPLYTYPSEQSIEQKLYRRGEREANLEQRLTAEMERRLGLRFLPEGEGDLRQTFGPEDVFHYIYAVFHSPTYRERYDQFLRADFPASRWLMMWNCSEPLLTWAESSPRHTSWNPLHPAQLRSASRCLAIT